MALVTRYLSGRIEVKLSSQRCLGRARGKEGKGGGTPVQGNSLGKAQRTEMQQGICNMQIVMESAGERRGEAGLPAQGGESARAPEPASGGGAGAG